MTQGSDIPGQRDSGAGLTYRQRLPLRLSPVAALPDMSAMLQQVAGNELLLRACIALQDHHEVDGRDIESAELQRIELKLDLILSCLQQAMVGGKPLPAPASVTLTPEQLSGEMEDGLDSSTIGTLAQAARDAEPTPVRVELYLSPLAAVPLVLHGHLATDSSKQSWQIKLVLPGEHLQQLLEKLIFRYHRQSVALGVCS